MKLSSASNLTSNLNIFENLFLRELKGIMESTHALVLEVLHRASSQNPEILKPAEAKLREWETQPGFYSVLFVSEIFKIMLANFTFMNL